MAEIPVTHFGLVWFPEEKRGTVSVQLHGGQTVKFKVESAADLAGYAAILNEKPVFWDPDKKKLGTGWEPIEDV